MDNLDDLKAMAANLPDDVRENALTLLEEMGTPVEGIGDDPTPWRPNFLRLVQGTTDRGSLPKGTSIGDFVLGERKIEQPLKFIPIRIWDARQYWDPDQTNNKMLCWSPDAKFGHIGRECKGCPHAEWKEGVGNDCGKTKSVLALASDFSAIFTIQFSKSNFKIGTELEGLMKRAAVAPYNRTYGLRSATSTTAKNVENYKIEVLDEKLRRTPAENIPFLKELFNRASVDRKAMLESFYEVATAKRDALALAAPKEETNLQLETTLVVETAPAAVSSAAKNYVM
jgi:hypothetical protein